MNFIHTGIIAATAATTALGGISATNAVEADMHREPPIIEKIATRFNINIEELRTFFSEQKNEEREEKRARAEINFETRLQAAVESEKLTQAQADLIVEKRTELQARHEEQRAGNDEQTPEERRARMSEMHTSTKAWAQTNNIDLKWIMPQHNMKPFMQRKDHKQNIRLRLNADARASQS